MNKVLFGLLVITMLTVLLVSCVQDTDADTQEFLEIVGWQKITYPNYFTEIIAKVVDKSDGTVCYIQIVQGGIFCISE